MSLFNMQNSNNTTNTIDTTVKLVSLKDRTILRDLASQIKDGTILIIDTTPLKNRTDEMKAEEFLRGYSLALDGSMTKIASHMLLVGNNKLAVEREAHKQINTAEVLPAPDNNGDSDNTDNDKD